MEGIGCGVMGVTPTNVSYYLWAISRDLQRGWTYDHACNRVPMTQGLAIRRATYLIALSRKHTGRMQPEVVNAVRGFIMQLHTGRVPAAAAPQPQVAVAPYGVRRR